MDYEVEVEDKSICKLGSKNPSKWYYDDSPNWIEITDNNRYKIEQYLRNNPDDKFKYILSKERNNKYRYGDGYISTYETIKSISIFNVMVAIHFYD